VVFGVGNTAGTIAGLVAVPVTGWVLHHTGSWALAFSLAAAHNVVGAALWARWVGDARLREDGGATESDVAAALAGAAAAAGGPVVGGGGAGGGAGGDQIGKEKAA